jgi:hypothetical protein
LEVPSARDKKGIKYYRSYKEVKGLSRKKIRNLYSRYLDTSKSRHEVLKNLPRRRRSYRGWLNS